MRQSFNTPSQPLDIIGLKVAVYFLFVPGGRWASDPMILFTRTTWDLIHTWAGVVLIAAAIVHFTIHWKWATKVTRKMIGMALPTRTGQQPVPVANS